MSKGRSKNGKARAAPKVEDSPIFQPQSYADSPKAKSARNMIHLDHITMSYDSHVVLDDINLRVPGRSETLASQRRLPSSMLPSQISR